MRSKLIMVVVLLQLSATLAFGQNQVQGVIYSKEDRSPISYANIIFSGEESGTISNSDGIYVLSNINSGDTVVVSYIGFKSITIPVSDLIESSDIYMTKSVTIIDDIVVNNEKLSAKKIMKRVKLNFKRNHSLPNREFKVYYHPEEIFEYYDYDLKLKKSSIDRIDQNFLDKIVSDAPEKAIIYKDLISDIYIWGGNSKGQIIDGVALPNQAEMDFTDQFSQIENMIKSSLKSDDNFWKLKSGIFGMKIDEERSSTSVQKPAQEEVPDSLVKRDTPYIRSQIVDGLNLMDGDDPEWDFISRQGRYNYRIEDITEFNGEYVFHIIFEPSGGKYMGEMYVSEDSYALLKVNYKYAPNKDGIDISIFGIDLCQDLKEESVIFQKYGDCYLPKYRRILEGMSVKIDRPLELKEKKRGSLFSKEIRSAKVNFMIDFNLKESMEILILSDSELAESQFKDIEETKYTYIKKINKYNREIVDKYSIILPKSEVLQYRKPEDK